MRMVAAGPNFSKVKTSASVEKRLRMFSKLAKIATRALFWPTPPLIFACIPWILAKV